MNNESVGKKIVEALKKQAENMDMEESNSSLFEDPISETTSENVFKPNNDIFAEPVISSNKTNFFDDVEEEKETLFTESSIQSSVAENPVDNFEMPSNIAVLKKLI